VVRSQQQTGVIEFPSTAIEPRTPVLLAIVAVILLLAVLPSRVRVFPTWVPWLLLAALMVSMIPLTLKRTIGPSLLHIERVVTAIFLVIAGSAIIVELDLLLTAMVRHSSGITGAQLITSSTAVWATNVLVFSVTYWRIDRGGPEDRANNARKRPDWTFPQENAGESVAAAWRPTFVDYLFLAYCTATAFSPTDAQPVTSRAKVLMMVESTISLVTTAAVASRAINILGS